MLTTGNKRVSDALDALFSRLQSAYLLNAEM